jgi:hypothetical protein
MHKQVLVVKSGGKRLVERPRYRCEDNTEHGNKISEVIRGFRFTE